MEYNLRKKSVNTAHILLDTVSEQPVDVDITLPDYCPDIERIVRCSLRPMIYLSNISTDRLNVEGGACLRVIYLDSEKKRLSSFEYTVPFSESFPLKDSPEEFVLYTDAKTEYINCRALSPRKLSLHGAFSLYARIVVKRPMSYNVHDDDDGLMVHTGDVSVSELCGLCRELFSVREDIPMSGYPETAVIINHRLSVRITELKAVRRKLMLTAEGRLELVYLSDRDSGDVESMSCSFPISRVIDCDGADDDAAVEARLDLMSYELKLSEGANGSENLTVDMRLCLNAMCSRERGLSLIDDVFSTERDTVPVYEPFGCRGCTRVLCFSDNAEREIKVDGERITRVISVSAERITVTSAISGGAPLLSSKLNVSMMYVNGEGDTRCVDRDIDFNYNPSADGFDSIDAVTAAVDSLSYRITGDDTVELRTETDYRVTVSRKVCVNALSSVSSDDDAPPIVREGTLILYYADKGETVWDIAKRFSSAPGDIMSENGLDADILADDRMLLIPNMQSG